MPEEVKLEKKSFKDTLNLPKTDFPIRPNAKVDDGVMLNRWQEEDLYKKSFELNKGKEKFILHDGPPYANGNIHLGHAYNYILKDIVTKYHRMSGKNVPVTPGWDCHGLPIELKVAQEKSEWTREDLKKACRAYANKWINIQKEEFKKLGVLMNWDDPYLTMSPDYESFILKAFGIFVEQKFVERKNKTVPWCPSCQTVLASAEIEYQDRKDPSIYVLFSLTSENVQKLLPDLKDKSVNLLVWTTTPWTLPLNRAVLFKQDSKYVVLDALDKYIIVAKDLADKISNTLNIPKNIIKELDSQDLINSKVYHPFIDDLIVPVLPDQSVSLQDGTAFVHCAPGCGPEDYEVGIRNKLEIFSPISTSGKYTKGIEPKELEGMDVKDGQKWVIEKLVAKDKLLFKATINHSYPHCWRCRGPLIFRATKQWFIDLSHEGLRKNVLQAVDKINMFPVNSNNRLKATLEGRLEWCISRQRIWGVPIPALICNDCDTVFITQDLIDKVAQNVARDGIEYWDTVNINDLIKDISCNNCKSKNFRKETDILDVWFDSGVSHYAVLKQNPALQFPADLYLEGKDQHRGWFQSSLLTSMVIEKEGCMKEIVTHGFTVDELGKKMSKSIGNVVVPDQIIEMLGTDGLRLWASSIDLKDEVIVSEALLRNVKEVYAKIRNTCRFLLSNLYDFDISKDAIDVNELYWVDKYALTELYSLNFRIKENYKNYKLTGNFHEFADYCTKDLSAFYLDIIKDRLYVEKSDGKSRRSAQTVCWYILDNITRLMAPILSFTSEIISDHYQKNKTSSIHLQTFANIDDLWQELISQIKKYDFYKRNNLANELSEDQNLIYWKSQWETVLNIRNAILKAIEQKRESGIIKHPLEAHITIAFDLNKKELADLLSFLNDLQKHSKQTKEDFFKDLLIVSGFTILEAPEVSGEKLDLSDYKGLYVNVSRAQGDKCPRCWQYTMSDNLDKLCKRCQQVIEK